MKKLVLASVLIAAGAFSSAPARAEDQNSPAPPPEAAAPVAAPPAAEAPAAEKNAVPPDSEWVHPTK